jgi:hypothetical protein
LSSPSITVRYDAQNAESVVAANTKIVKSLDAMRTGAGQLTSSVKQMETGFRADALGGFTTSVTNADAKITGFRAKLSQIGSTFSQNATSFGVATASIWGVYNAYDSLEKVQIRAHAAAQRVSTLETTIATLTERRRQAVDKGNLSAEQMAILDDRITNAHNKLSVAQERNADLQQDVNEAWAAFASQVGPQVVAAGSSVVQLVTNLRGSFGNIIPSIKGFVTSIGSTVLGMGQTTGASLLLRPALGGIGPAAEVGAVGIRALSGAMKGLLIGTGIGALVVGIGFIIEALMNLNQASADTATETTDAFGEAAKGPQLYTTSVQSHLDAADEIIKKHAETTKTTLGTMNADYIKSVKDQLEFDKQLAEVSVRKVKGFADEATAKRKTLEADKEHLNVVQLVLKYGLDFDKQLADAISKEKTYQGSLNATNQGLELIKSKLLAVNPAYQEAVAKQQSAAQAADLLQNHLGELIPAWTKTAEGAKSYVDSVIEQNKATILATGSLESAKGPLEEHIKANFGASGALNLRSVAEAELDKKLKELFPDEEKVTKVEKDRVKTLEEEAQAQAEIILKSTIQREQISKIAEATQKENAALTQVFGARAVKTAADLQGTEAGKQLIDIATQTVNAYQTEELQLVTLAAKYGIHNDLLLDAITTEGDQTDALKDLIIQQLDWSAAITDGTVKMKAMKDGWVAGVQELADFTTNLVKNKAQLEITHQGYLDLAKDLKIELPKGITLTNENLRALIEAEGDAGKEGQIMGQLMDEAFGNTRDSLQELIDAATKGGKDWKSAWKDVKDLIPKSVRDEFKEFLQDQAELQKTVDRNTTVLEGYSRIWSDLSANERKDITKQLAEDIGKLGDELDDVSDADVDTTLIQPLLKLKEGGLTAAELDVWKGFFDLFATLKAEGGGIDENDVKILQDYVNTHTGMGELANKTEDTTTAFEDLDPAVQKIVLNNVLARTINQVTIDLNLQGRAVRGLTTDFGNLVDIMKQMIALRPGGGKNNGFTNVSGDIPFDPTFQRTPESEGDGQTKNVPKTVTVVFKADIKQYLTAVDTVVKRAQFVDALRPIVDFLGDHRQFMKAASDVGKVVQGIDKMRPIVDFLGDHRQFMKAGSDVVKVVQAIDKLRPIVDFLGDHRQFMRAASDVEKKVKQIDGMVATVTIKAKRVGDFSAQHGMHATLSEDAFIYAHKNERVDISPPGDTRGGTTNQYATHNTTVAGAKTVHLEMPIYLFPGASMLSKLIKEIPLEDTGMYASA